MYYPLEEVMTTSSSILAWRIPISRGAWRVAKSQTGRSDEAQHSTYYNNKNLIITHLLSYGLCRCWYRNTLKMGLMEMIRRKDIITRGGLAPGWWHTHSLVWSVLLLWLTSSPLYSSWNIWASLLTVLLWREQNILWARNRWIHGMNRRKGRHWWPKPNNIITNKISRCSSWKMKW